MHRPAMFTTSVVSVTTRGSADFVTVEVANTGDQTAADVTVQARLLEGGSVSGRVLAEASQQITYLGGGERQRVVYVFGRRVGDHAFEVSVSGYRVP
jgi:uncharacterized protein (TIGR02588 family)